MIGKKIFVTGAKGMLGSKIIDKFSDKNIVGYGREMDITDQKLVMDILTKEAPEIIIHTAALTNVEECEYNIDKCYKINILGTQNLVNYCIGKSVLFIYISSTGVYGKNDSINTEFSFVNPTTVHHKSKYEGEKIVANHCNKFLIIRTGWLYGGEKEHLKNFVYRRYLEGLKNKIIYSDNSQIGNPTNVIDLINQIEILIQYNQVGIFNCVNKAENISRYEYVKLIIESFGLKTQVKVANEGHFKRLANVSHNESATNYKLDLLNLNFMGDWKVSLISYIDTLKLFK